MDNVPVNSPDVLRDIDSDELHLIICIKILWCCKAVKGNGNFKVSYI